MRPSDLDFGRQIVRRVVAAKTKMLLDLALGAFDSERTPERECTVQYL